MNWKNALFEEIAKNHDDPHTLIHTMTDREFDAEFDDSYGGISGCSFTAWTDNYVYFPVQYDGSEWAGSAPRHPCLIETDHQGGG
jgi:hypothetical protein